MYDQATHIAEDDHRVSPEFSYTLIDCVENVGVGLVPAEQAKQLLPAPFSLPDPSQPLTPLVVLTLLAGGIAVAGGAPQAGAYVQLGLIVAPPDGTGDINTLFLWHYTSHRELAYGLQRLGLASQYVPQIAYSLARDGDTGATSVRVPRPAQPALALAGTLKLTQQPLPGGFVANWWAKLDRGLLKSSTHVPEGTVSEAELGLSTDADSALGQLVGGASLGFAVLQNFNAFPYARTSVDRLQVER